MNGPISASVGVLAGGGVGATPGARSDALAKTSSREVMRRVDHIGEECFDLAGT